MDRWRRAGRTRRCWRGAGSMRGSCRGSSPRRMRRRRSEVYEAANCLWDVDYRIRCVRSLIPLNPTHHRNFIGKVTLLYVESIGAIITPISSKTEMRDKLMQTPEGISAEIEN